MLPILRIVVIAMLAGSVSGAIVVTNGANRYNSSYDSTTNLIVKWQYPLNWGRPMPLLFIQAGYSNDVTGGASNITDAMMTQIATNGIVVCSFGLRQREGASGFQNSHDECMDIMDGLNLMHSIMTSDVLTNNADYGLGSSGGGGNTALFTCMFPDRLNATIIYFGIYDYGYNNTPYTDPVMGAVGGHSWWYQNNAPGGISQHIGNLASGGTVTNLYYARASMQAIATNLQGGHLFDYHNDVDSTVVYDQSIQMTNAFHTAGNDLRLTARFSRTLYQHGGSTFLTDSIGEWLGVITNGTYSQWAASSGTFVVLGYMQTRNFTISIDDTKSGVADAVCVPHSYTVTPRTGSMTVTVTEGGLSQTKTSSSAITFTFVATGNFNLWNIGTATFK